MLLEWHISITTAVGLSSGLVEIWDPRWVIFKAYICFVGIILEACVRGMDSHIHILNTYAPYGDRSIFWNCLFSSSIIELASLIFSSDLNYTIALEEVWGRSRRIDHLAGMFRDALLAHNFVNICPKEMAPTWDNGCTSVAYFAKRMDHFLMHE